MPKQKIKHLLIVMIVLLSLTPIQAKGPAGTVLYFRDGHQVYLLIADDADNTRGWSAFGGGANKGESEAQTAARETEEETRGFFSKEWLLKQIKDKKPFKSEGYSFFFVEVPFVPAQRIMNNSLKNANKSMHERVHYAWIPESDLKHVLTSKNNKIDSKYLPSSPNPKIYWNIWLNGMRDAYKQNACPWQKIKKTTTSQ